MSSQDYTPRYACPICQRYGPAVFVTPPAPAPRRALPRLFLIPGGSR